MPKKNKKEKKEIVVEEVWKDLSDSTEQYAVLHKALGGCKFLILCEDKQERIGLIRGRMKNKSHFKLNVGDVVLVSVRSFQLKQADILGKLMPHQISTLKKQDKAFDKFILTESHSTSSSVSDSAPDIPFDFTAI